MNSGYVGYSRSKRSQSAIENYEVPYSLINGKMISSFLQENEDEFSDNDLKYLQSQTITMWKYVAKEIEGSSSWHHTSSYFNETDHFDLLLVAERMIDIGEKELKNRYKAYKERNEKSKLDYKYGFISVQVWGGSRKRPRLIGYDEVFGIVYGNWLYYLVDGEGVKRYKIHSNKVEKFQEYSTLEMLQKEHHYVEVNKQYFDEILYDRGIVEKI